MTNEFPIRTGILQGDVLAPYLFVLVLDRILYQALDRNASGILMRSEGARSRGIKGFRVSDVDYADDVALVSSSAEGLLGMVESTAREAAPANLRLAVGESKTAWMTFGKPSGADLSLSSNYCGALPKVPKYRHLGNLQGGQGTMKDRLRLAWAAFTKLRAPLKPSTELRLFDALVYPVLNFCSGALSVPLKTLRCIDVQVNVVRRTACNTGRLDEFQKSSTRS